jgi:predicted MFS family arabinose efflux permease
LFSTLPVFYKEVMKLSEWTIGMLMGLNGVIIVVIEMVLVFRLESRQRDMHLIALGAMLTGGSFILLNLLPPVLFTALLAMITVTFGEIFAMPFMNTFWTRRTVPGNRGQYAGMYTMAWSLAQVTGPTAGTWIAGHIGFPVLWWITAALCLLTAFLFRSLNWKTTGETAQNS